MGIAVLLHTLAATVWVGGLFFALVCLRPAATGFEAAERVRLWAEVLARFYPWIWLAIALLLVTGVHMTLQVTGIGEDLGGLERLRAAGAHIHVMMGLGIVMMLLSAHVYFAPLRRLRRAVAESHWADAGKNLNQARAFLAVSLAFGLLIVGIGAGGRYFFR